MDIQAVKVFLEVQNKTFRTTLGIVVEHLKSSRKLGEEILTEMIKSFEFFASGSERLER